MAIDPQYYGYYQQGLLDEGVAPPAISGPDFVRGMKYAPFDLLGAPVDLANMALSPLGLGSDMPVGGSDYLINKYADLGDLLGVNYDRPTGSGSETLGRITSGILAPTVGAKTVGRVVQGVGDYVAGAPARVADRARSVTLGSGIDPTSIVDDLIVRGMGDNGGPPMVPEAPVRDVDELGFYSQALEVAQGLKQKKGTGQQFEAMLLKGGVKPDEIAFTPGLRGLLDQPQVTQEELVGLLQDQRVRPQETVFYGGESQYDALNFPDRPEVLSMEDAYGADYISDEIEQVLEFELDDALAIMSRADPFAYPESDLPKIQMAIEGGDPLPQSIMEDLESAAEEIVRTRYEYDPVVRLQDPDTGYEIVGSDDVGYSIRDEGGQYIDLGNNIPYSLSEARIQAENHAMDAGLVGYGGGETRFSEHTEPSGTNYREILLQVPEYEGMRGEFVQRGHFDEPNIAVHARTKDRATESGSNDVLYVEELQSDWAQQGRDKGFATKESIDKKRELEAAITPLMDEQMRLSKERDKLIEDYGAKIADKQAAKSPLNDEGMYYSRYGSVYRLEPDESSVLVLPRSQVEEILQLSMDQAYPFRPGKETDWELAAGPKYNELSSKIKDLTSQIKPIKDELSELPSGPQKGPLVGNTEKFAEAGIKRLLIQAANEGKKYVSFSPGDLQADRWNNPGLEVYYDDIIPKVAKKVVKRFDKDAFTGNKYIEELGDRFTIEITPKMREAIQKGVPLFTTGGAGLLGAGMAREERPQPTEGIL